MKTPKAPLTPKLERQAKALGERFALARRRRMITGKAAAARARTSPSTLSRFENGDATVSLDVVLRLLSVYGLSEDIDALAADDKLGRDLQDANIVTKKRVRG